jgi:hypothetical protein
VSAGVKLLFGVHAHQPAGNFPSVVRDAHERCYRPFLQVLHRHPAFRFSIHISGWLLEFLAAEFPDDLDLLRRMVARGQAEIIGGGDTEPVLAAIPDADRRGQISAMSRRLFRRFGARPRGAWLAERVWEATIVPALADGGIRYAMVDDYHFLCAGHAAEELDGAFSTEEDTKRLDLFPISEALRYRFPFAPAAEAVSYLEGMRDGAAAIYFDDIEKFGIWPQTYEWVYERRWLEDFVEAVLRSPRIEPMRYGDYHAATRVRGIVYLPTVSYIEMGEWALPPPAARRYAALVARAKRDGTFQEDKPFLRGGNWRNFFGRYRESNWMHKRMESASRRFHGLDEKRRTAAMRTDLHLAQANDAYWHGMFGGIYLPHLRRNVYAAIARLERAVDAHAGRPAVDRVDLDLDGRDEVFLWCPQLLAVVRPEDGASLCELTHYRLAHNFCDVLARRDEQYFDKIRERSQSGDSGGGGIASIHDRIAFRSPIAEADLAPDRDARTSFRDFWTADARDPVQVDYVRSGSKSGKGARFTGGPEPLSVEKSIAVSANGLTVRYDIASAARAGGLFEVELNIAMPSCDGPGGSLEADGAPSSGFAERWSGTACAKLRLVDAELMGSVEFVSSIPADIVAEPLVTVSQSAEGFEKIMQAVVIRAKWRLDLAPGTAVALTTKLDIVADRRSR